MSRKIAEDFNSIFLKVNVAEVLRKISSDVFSWRMSRKTAEDFNSSFIKLNVAEVLREIS